MNQTELELSQAIAEQAEDLAFLDQARRACEHIWEKIDNKVWLCEICWDLVDFSETEPIRGRRDRC